MLILLVLTCAAVGIPLLALWGDGRRGAVLFIGFNTLTLLAILALAMQVLHDGAFTAGGGQFMVDDLSIVLVLVDGVVGLSTAWFSRNYMLHEKAHWSLSRRRVRLYHAMLQTFLATMLLALLTNNMGILWVAINIYTHIYIYTHTHIYLFKFLSHTSEVHGITCILQIRKHQHR